MDIERRSEGRFSVTEEQYIDKMVLEASNAKEAFEMVMKCYNWKQRDTGEWYNSQFEWEIKESELDEIRDFGRNDYVNELLHKAFQLQGRRVANIVLGRVWKIKKEQNRGNVKYSATGND